MPKHDYADGYLKGYEQGLRESLDELTGIIGKRSYNSTEVQLLAKNQRVSIPQKVRKRRKTLAAELDIDLEPRKESGGIRQNISPGRTILVKGPGPDEAYELFRDVLRQGWEGLCISRYAPAELREFLDMPCQVMWLTKADPAAGQADREEYIQPTEVARMQSCIRGFLTKNSGKRSVILLDGLNFIIINNDFKSFLKLAQKLKDDVYQANSLLIMPLNPTTMQEGDLNLLEDEMS